MRFMGLHVLARQGPSTSATGWWTRARPRTLATTPRRPLLIADGGNVEVTIIGMHNHRVEAGRVLFLYRNTGGVIRTGDGHHQIGDLR